MSDKPSKLDRLKYGFKKYNKIQAMDPTLGKGPEDEKSVAKSPESNPYAYGFVSQKNGLYFQYNDKDNVWVNHKTGKKIRKDAGERLWLQSRKRYPKGATKFQEELQMTDKVQEGLADMADLAERDHEVQMARADLYKIAKYAIKLHDMLKGVSEAEGIEGWMQSKITKAADYMGSVYHTLDYDTKFNEGVTEGKDKTCSDKCCGADVKAEDCTCPASCEHCNCNAVSEGKSPHKKGSKKYKKHMAAMHAESRKDEYKSDLHARLAERTLGTDEVKKKKR
jgi:hypothetical protein